MDLEATVAEVLPIVEEVTGRKFREPPLVRAGSAGKLRAAVVDESAALYLQLLPQLAPSSARTLAFWEAELLLPSVFGKYVHAEQTVYLRSRSIPTALERAGERRDLGPGIAKLVLAHELAHALQDQEVDLEAGLAGLGTLDAFHAYAAVVEGHAAAVEHAVAGRLGLGEERSALKRLQGREGVVGLYYTDGLAFVDAVADDPARAWEVLGDPPRHTRAVYRPDQWHTEAFAAPTGDPWPEVSSILRLGGAGLRRDFGEFELRQQIAGATADARERLTTGFHAGVSVRSTSANPTAELALYTFADEAAAALLVDVARDSYEAAREQLVGQTYAALEITVDEVPGLEAPHVRMRTRISLTQGAPAEGTVVWAQAGHRVVRLDLGNVRRDDEDLAAAITALTRW
jgi:hypothetical protein